MSETHLPATQAPQAPGVLPPRAGTALRWPKDSGGPPVPIPLLTLQSTEVWAQQEFAERVNGSMQVLMDSVLLVCPHLFPTETSLNSGPDPPSTVRMGPYGAGVPLERQTAHQWAAKPPTLHPPPELLALSALGGGMADMEFQNHQQMLKRCASKKSP